MFCCGKQRRKRRGQSLVEFALVALIMYLLVAGIITFGHMLYVGFGLQQAADLGAREISRTPLPPDAAFEDVLADATVLQNIYSDDFLVFDLDTLAPNQSFYQDVVPAWPLLNQQLASLMIVDRPDLDGDGKSDARLLRYPGALLRKDSSPTGFTVGIPIVLDRGETGTETIRWVPVVEEIDTEPNAEADSGANPDPFKISSPHRGLVALRINYPYQAAMMSGFRENATETTKAQPLELQSCR